MCEREVWLYALGRRDDQGADESQGYWQCSVHVGWSVPIQISLALG